MIGTDLFVMMGCWIAFGMVVPVAAAVWWIRTRKEKITTVLIGAATWFVFSQILEIIPKLILFNPALSIGKTVMGNAVLFTVAGALLAGLFEETGRFVAFKTVLKKRRNRETSISHGIGHGGFEAMFMLVISGLQYMVYAVMINTGTFQTVVDQIASSGADSSAIAALPEQLMSMTYITSVMGMLERIFAMMLHVALSILVFYAVKESKIWMYFLAIAVHSLFDVPAAMYQYGVVKNIFIIEGVLAVFSFAALIISYRMLYGRDCPGVSVEDEPYPG